MAHLKQQNREYREALEIIAGQRPCVDNLLSNKDLARITLLDNEVTQ